MCYKDLNHSQVNKRKTSVYQHVTSSVDLFVSLLDKSITSSISTAGSPVMLSPIYFRTYIYKTLNSFLGSFNRRIVLNVKQSIMGLILKDFKHVSKYYKSVVVSEDNDTAIATTPDFIAAYPEDYFQT